MSGCLEEGFTCWVFIGVAYLTSGVVAKSKSVVLIVSLLVLSGLLFQSTLLIRAGPSEIPMSKRESHVLHHQGWVSSYSLYYLRHQRSCAASAVGAQHDSSAGP